MWADLEAYGQMQNDQDSVVEKLRACLEKVCAEKLQDVNAEADFPSRLGRFVSEVLEGDDLSPVLDCISTMNQCNLDDLALEKDEWAKLARQAHDVANLFLGLFNQMIPRTGFPSQPCRGSPSALKRSANRSLKSQWCE